jgi:thiol-disulfide isomerase/thioredoxin
MAPRTKDDESDGRRPRPRDQDRGDGGTTVPRTLVVVQRLALLAAILASTALIIDYQNIGDPTFCGTESSCFKVRASDVGRDLAGYAAKLSIGKGKATVPHIGLLAHVALLALAFVATNRFWMRVVAGVASLGACAAIYLLVAQLRMEALCAWCAVVDVASIVCAVSSILIARSAQRDPEPAWGREGQTATSLVVWSAAAALMVALPYVWFNYSASAPLPPPIQALQVPGKVTVISYTDFECPYCRKLAPTLAPLHEDSGVVVKRMMAPLADIHPGAQPAALAYLCIEDELKDDYARLLYEAPDGAFSPGNLAWIAFNKAKSKQPREAFEACQASPETMKKLEAEKAIFKEAGGTGLPTTWVGKRMVKGFQPDKVIAALEAEKRGSNVALPVWAMFVAAAAIAAWTTAMHVRAARALEASVAKRVRLEKVREATEAEPKKKPRRSYADDEEAAARDAMRDVDTSPDEPRPKKARRKPATTVAETPKAKRSRSGEHDAAQDDANGDAKDDASRDTSGEGPAEPKGGDVVASKETDRGEGSGDKT